ncbi:MAG: hypothetical protein JWN01_601 [Patescibacteria group bacterium]|nr:hypothetical protein [Patescibacteria group bacterium]
MNKNKKWSRLTALAGSMVLVGYILFVNAMPLGVSYDFKPGNKNVSSLGPGTRVETLNRSQRLIQDLAYFTSNMTFLFEHARVRMAIKTSDVNQVAWLGYKDQQAWHYNNQVISAPFIDSLGWARVGEGPYLYQKQPSYKSYADFMANTPRDKFIGVYNYSDTALRQSKADMSGYKPATAETVVSTPIRGKVTMYAYLANEPFRLAVEKRDLNWYKDPDVATVKVYKDTDKVFETTIGDDGNTNDDHHPGASQQADIKNPGPGLPEAGVYKIVIDAPDDSIITKIATNMHKITFEGPLHLAGNHEVYGDVVPPTASVDIFTNATDVSAQAFSRSAQTLIAGGKSVPLTQSQTFINLASTPQISAIKAPKSDIVINGVGYFAFSQDQFFEPTPYHILQITGPKDLEKVDYVLTNYKPPKQLGDGWVEVEREFDLSGAVVQKGKLSWVISAPGLADNKRSIEIKDIQMTLTKKGWFK